MIAGKECRLKLVHLCFKMVVNTKTCSYFNRNDSREEEIHSAGERRKIVELKYLSRD